MFKSPFWWKRFWFASGAIGYFFLLWYEKCLLERTPQNKIPTWHYLSPPYSAEPVQHVTPSRTPNYAKRSLFINLFVFAVEVYCYTINMIVLNDVFDIIVIKKFSSSNVTQPTSLFIYCLLSRNISDFLWSPFALII